MQAFYRGLIPSLVAVSNVVVQFPLYEKLKTSFGTLAELIQLFRSRDILPIYVFGPLPNHWLIRSDS